MRMATLEIGQLDLDPINPRTNPGADQSTAMRSLISVERDGEKIYTLALNICRVGMLDPGDRLYTIESPEDPGRFVVLDGNRRLTALRLLSQPALVDRDDIGLSSSLRQRFKRLQKEYAGRWPSKVDVVIYESREAAAPFIRLRHTGENEGAGRSAWSALQVARFDDSGIWLCLKYLRDHAALNLVAVNQLAQSSFPITNFDRVASTAEFQTRFGIELGASSFSIVGDKQRALAALTRLTSDVASGRVDSRGMFAEARNMSPYFDELESAIGLGSTSTRVNAGSPSSKGKVGHQEDPEPSGSVGSQNDGAASVSSATAIAPVPNLPTLQRKQRESKYLIDKKELTTVTNQKCRAMVDELKGKVPVSVAPYACALLLRSLQELTAELYLEAFGLKRSNRTANIDQAANHLLGNAHGTDPANRIALATSFKKSSASYEELCETAHSALNSVSPDHVRATWRNLGGGMDLLWKRIHAEMSTKKAA